MAPAPFGPWVSLLLFIAFAVRSFAQQPSTPTAIKDPRALLILARSLSAMGGANAISAIQDYVGTGNITFHWAGQEVQGSVTARGMGIGNYRMDAAIPDGTETWICGQGISGILTTPDGKSQTYPFYDLMTEGSRTIPAIRVATEIGDSTTSITYVGLVASGGSEMYQIHFAQAVPPTSTAQLLPGIGQFDLYIDPTSLLITKLIDTVRPPSDFYTTLPHEFDFADYQTVGNIAVPFSISENINGQQTWSMKLNSVLLNVGLSSDVFNVPLN